MSELNRLNTSMPRGRYAAFRKPFEIRGDRAAASLAARVSIVLLFVGLAAAVGVAIPLSPIIAVSLVAGTALLLLLIFRPRWSMYAALFLSITALPGFVPVTIYAPGITIQLFEPFLFIALIYALFKLKGPRSVDSSFVMFLVLLAAGLGVGVANGANIPKIIYDCRPLVEGAAALFIASRVAHNWAPRAWLNVIRLSLWVSAAVTFAGATLGFAVVGRTEAASLDLGAETGDATRLITAATFPALAVLCGVVALAIAGRVNGRRSWPYVLPALTVVVLSFSRNSLLAVAIAVIFALVASRSTRAGFKSVALVGGTVLVFVALVAVGPTLASLPGGAWINLQVTSYGDRVLSGLSAEAQAADSSIQYRDIEDVYLLEAVRTSPVVGHGFGYAYKPPSGQSDFLLNYAPYYAHNFYLWLLAKTGVLGGVLFAFVVIPPLLRVLRSASNAALAAAAGLASMLAVSFVAPIPLGGASSILFGALVGFVTVKSKSYAEYGTLNAHRPDVPRTGNQLTVS